MNIIFFIQFIHEPYINKDQNNEYVNGPLLRKPKTKFCTANTELVHCIDKKYSEDIWY